MNRNKQGLQATSIPALFEEVRMLVSAKAPCITGVLAIPDPLQLESRLNNLIHQLEKRLKNVRLERSAADELLAPIRALAAAVQDEGDWSVGLAVYRSADQFHHFFLRDLPNDFLSVAQRFNVRPLLTLVRTDPLFYLLALSQKHVRLFRCTYQSEHELQLRRLAPDNLHAWLNHRIPDHVLNNRASAGPSVGSMRGVQFGTNTDRERHDEYLRHFFREVDEGVRQWLVNETAPLLLAGIETETSLYRKLNTYPRLLPRSVPGSPEKLTAIELHYRALPIIAAQPSAPLQKALDLYPQFRDQNRVSTKASEVVERAMEGRVSHLLTRDDAVYFGVRDPNDLEDLLNLAALQTLKHRGETFSLKSHEMPDGLDVVGLLRF